VCDVQARFQAIIDGSLRDGETTASVVVREIRTRVEIDIGRGPVVLAHAVLVELAVVELARVGALAIVAVGEAIVALLTGIEHRVAARVQPTAVAAATSNEQRDVTNVSFGVFIVALPHPPSSAMG
jgi:hypothetical protein